MGKIEDEEGRKTKKSVRVLVSSDTCRRGSSFSTICEGVVVAESDMPKS